MVQHTVQKISTPRFQIRNASLQRIMDGDDLRYSAAASHSALHASRDISDVSYTRVSFGILMDCKIKNDSALCIRIIL
ncbi:hypothetical protein D3C75_964560 [compost metagenome]